MASPPRPSAVSLRRRSWQPSPLTARTRVAGRRSGWSACQPTRCRRKWRRRKAGPAPETDVHPGEPDPRRAEQQWPGEEHDHARGDVVPADAGRVHIRGVRADEHGHGIGLGTPGRPRPGARGADAANDETGATASVTHLAASVRLAPASGAWSGLPARIHPDGSDPVWGVTPGVTPGGTPPHTTDRASGQKGGVAPVISRSAGADRSCRSRTINTNNDGDKLKVGL